MQEEHKARLKYHRKALIDDLDFEKVRDALVSSSVIDDEDEERIASSDVRRDRARELLRILPRRGSSAYARLLDALRDPYEHLHDLLVRPLDEEEEENDDVAQKRVKEVLLRGHVPPRPVAFVDRPNEIARLRDALRTLKDADGWVVLHGMGGSGKTSLAAEALRDPHLLRQCFPNGVFWLTIGQLNDERGQVDQAKLLMKMNNLCARLDDDSSTTPTPASGNVEEAHDRLHDLFVDQHPRTLLVLDDVWSPVVARAFAVRARVLVTSRDRAIADQTRATRAPTLVALDAHFTVAQAKSVLAGWTGRPVAELPPEADDIIAESGSSPLAVSMIGALLQKNSQRRRWEYYLKNLRERKLNRIKRAIEYDYDALDASIGISVDALDDEQRERYLRLAVFEDDAVFTSQVLAVLWRCDDPVEVEVEYAEEFVNKSLVKIVGGGGGVVSYTMHDLLLDYLKAVGGARVAAYHREFVEGYRESCDDGNFARVEADGYVHANLILHMLRGGMRDDAATLLGSFEWVATKLRECGPAEALSDYLRFGMTSVKKSGGPRLDPMATQRSSSRQTAALSDFQRFISTNAHLFFDTDSFPDVVQLGLSEPAESDVYQQALAIAKEEAESDPKKVYIDWTNKRRVGEWHLMTQKVTDDPVRHVAFSRDDDAAHFVTCSDDYSVRIWASSTGKITSIFEGHNGVVYHSNSSLDRKRIVSCSEDGTVQVWNSSSGTLVTKFTGHNSESAVLCCSFSPDDKVVVSSSEDGTIKAWDSETGVLKFDCTPSHDGSVVTCLFSPDNKRIASASEDCTIKVWSASDGSLINTFDGHDSTVNDCAFSPDGTALVSASNDHTVRIWDGLGVRTSARCTLKKQQTHECCYPMLCCAYSAKYIAAGGADSNIEVWDALKFSHLFTLSGHMGWVHSCNFSTAGNRLISSSDDGNVKIWDMLCEPGRKRHDGDPSFSRRFSLHLKPSSSDDTPHPTPTLLAQDLKTGKLEIWNGKKGESEIPTESNKIKSWCLEPNGALIAVGYFSGQVEVFETGGRKLSTLDGHVDKIRHCFFSPCGTHLLTCSDDKTHKLWKVEDPDIPSSLDKNDYLVASTESDTKTANRPGCFFNKSITVVSATVTGHVKIWSTTTKVIEAHSDSVTSVAVSSDDEKIASASVDKTVKVWSPNGSQLNVFSTHSDVVRSCVFSSLGQFVASGSDDGQIKIWNLASGEEHGVCSGQDGWVVGVHFSKDDNTLVSISKNSIMWFSNTGQCLQVYRLKGQFPKAVHVADDFGSFFTIDDSGFFYSLHRI